MDSAEGMATLEAMSSHHNFRPGQRNKLVSESPIAAPEEHAPLVEADQRFRAALGQAIAAGGERIEAVEATVQLKRRTKLPRHRRIALSVWMIALASSGNANFV